MASVPKSLSERVVFYAGRINSITNNAAALGLTPEAAAALADTIAQAEAARTAQLDAFREARKATITFNQLVAEMSTQGAAIFAQARVTAIASDDVTIYGLAGLPAPEAPSPIGEPGTPADLKTSIDPLGQLTLTWTCKNPRGSEGTMYELHRRAMPDAPFEYLAIVGKKRYVDKTIPKGATAISYQIRAIRSTKRGAVAEFNVRFGSNDATPLPEFFTKDAMKNAA